MGDFLAFSIHKKGGFGKTTQISSSRTALPFSEHGKEAVNSCCKLTKIGVDSVRIAAIGVIRWSAPAEQHLFSEEQMAPSAGGGYVYTIGDLADFFGITHRALRFYEDKGMLKPRRVGRSVSIPTKTVRNCALS